LEKHTHYDYGNEAVHDFIIAITVRNSKSMTKKSNTVPLHSPHT
jgi:hypothetical protein